jgi:AcrR family transcriptional regulator
MAALGTDVDRPTGKPAGLRAEARERAILDAALELLRQVGYDRLSMDAVAERAHAGKATIYRHWSGKAELMADAVRRRKCDRLGISPDTGSLRSDLLATLAQLSASMTTDDAAIITGVISAMRTDAVLGELMRTQVFDNNRQRFDQIVERAEARGELPQNSSADLVSELIPALMINRLVIHGEPITEAFSVHLVDDVIMPLLIHRFAPTQSRPSPVESP